MNTRVKYIVAGIVTLAVVVIFISFVWTSKSAGGADGPGPAGAQGQIKANQIGQDLHEANEALGKLISGAGTGTMPPEVRKQRLASVFRSLKTVAALIPEDSFDIDAVAKKQGNDPARLFQWVRENTTVVPYQGSLRGAKGTLMDRRGNSLDRALLLAGLLRSGGNSVRLARATLTSQQVADINRPVVAPVADEADTARIKDGALSALDTFAKDAGLNAAQIRAVLQQVEDRSRSARENVRQRVERQTTMLAGTLEIPSVSESEDADTASSLQDHWWVQWRNGTEWSDLDLDTPKAGSVLAPGTAFFDPNKLPDDVHHAIQVRVIVEKWDGSKLEEQKPVSVDLRASELIGQALRLQHVPLAWPTGPMTGDVQESIKQHALSQHEWLPVFRVGSREVAGASIQDTGDLNSRPGTGTRPSPAGGLLDAFGGGADPGPTGVLTAEWIEYEIRSPGRPSRVIRREVFDILGGASRVEHRGPKDLTDELRLSRALNLLNETEILILPCQLSSTYVDHLAASRLASYEEILDAAIAAGPGAQPPVDRLTKLEPLPGLLHAFAVARGEWSRAPGSVYIREPNILTSHVFPHLSTNGAFVLSVALDVVASDVSQHHGSASERFKARLEQGVLDANIEAVLTGPSGQSTADVFGLDVDRQRWIPVRTTKELEGLDVGADARARLDADLRQGFVLLAYAAPGSSDTELYWWRVNPKTGDTISFGNRGWGQATVEYKILVAAAMVFGVCMVGASAGGSPSSKAVFLCFMLGAAVVGAFFASTGVVIGGFVGGQISTIGALTTFLSMAGFGFAFAR